MNKAKTAMIAAAAVHLLALAGLFLKQEPFYTYFYCFAWWTFIVIAAGVNHRTAGNSYLFDRTPEFVRLVLNSILIWLFFEAYNFRLENWYYVGVPLHFLLRWGGYLCAFATVVPGLFETERLLFNLGFGRSVKGLRLNAPRGLLYRFLLVGGLMMAAPLLSPATFFPLVWLGLIFLLDPILFLSRHREESFLAQASEGEYGQLIRFLFAGLICGFLWEFWNYWSGSKWIYSLPWADFLPIFEMPLLGYFGFAFFALECYLAFRVLTLLRELYWGDSKVRLGLVAVLAAAYTIAVLSGIDQMTVVSFKVLWGG